VTRSIINNDVKLYASILSPEQSVSFTLAPNRQGYLHLTQDVTGFDTEANETGLFVQVNGSEERTQLKGGDGLFLKLSEAGKGGELTITGAGVNNRKAEFVLFDLPRSHAQGENDEDDD